MSVSLDMARYARLLQETKDDVHAWVTKHGIDFTRCSGITIHGDEVRFLLIEVDELGNPRVGPDGRIARYVVTKPLLSQAPWLELR